MPTGKFRTITLSKLPLRNESFTVSQLLDVTENLY